MTTIQAINTNQPLVKPDGTPTRTTTAQLEAVRKRLNKIAQLDPSTATIADIISAAGDS